MRRAAGLTMLTVEVHGVERTAEVLRRYALGATAAEASAVVVGSNLAYAYGQHEGRTRGGRLARRGGGTYFLTRAAAAVAPTIGPTIARALEDGPAAVGQAMQAIGFRVQAAAVPLAPVRSGALRGSVHARLGRRR